MTALGTPIEHALRSVGHRIRRAHQHSVALFTDEVGPFGLTTLQYAALAAIAAGDDLDATRLAQQVAFDRSTVGAVLERLEAKGLIERQSRADDRRTKQLRTTPSGSQLLIRVDDAVRRSQERFLDVLEPHERETFMHLLATLIARHEATDEPV
jgi:DNA-binding MarR family transcriptional regulator